MSTDVPALSELRRNPMIDEAALAAEFSTGGGVSTRSRLRRRGLTDRQIDRLIASGRVLKTGRGVLVDACSPATWLREVAVACAASGGVASLHTALRVWGFLGVPPTNGKHVTVAHERHVVAPPALAALTRRLPRSIRAGVGVIHPPWRWTDLPGSRPVHHAAGRSTRIPKVCGTRKAADGSQSSTRVAIRSATCLDGGAQTSPSATRSMPGRSWVASRHRELTTLTS